MHICYLANATSPHTAKWAKYFAAAGHRVSVLTFEPAVIKDVDVLRLGLGSARTTRYFLAIPEVRRTIATLRPDLVHAHYASGYGTLGAWCGFHPYVVSVWGSDVNEFPRRSFIHRRLLQNTFSRADVLCSTSHDMAREIGRYTSKAVNVTPFGVDCSVFCGGKAEIPRGQCVIGTAKHLTEVYGLRFLLQAFAELVHTYRGPLDLRLKIAGSGPLKEELRRLSRHLGIAAQTTFLGAIPQEEMPQFLRGISIFVVPSLRESFGVVALEASATGVPVVASAVGGLPEVVQDGGSGFLVPPGAPSRIADALLRLVSDQALRARLGQAGRRFVMQRFSLDATGTVFDDLYRSVLASAAVR